MGTLGYYLLKSAIWLSGFALIYFIFLRNERFFLLKRIYLIAGIVVSIIFPLITFHYNAEMAVSPSAFSDSIAAPAESGTVNGTTGIPATFNFLYLISGLYMTGIIILAIRSGHQFLLIFRTIRNAKIKRKGPARIIITSEYTSSFSFFNYVFVSPSINENEAEEIMNHELVHVRQKHWFDLLLGEIIRLIQWANPFAWVYAGFIRLNHEYLADEIALQRSSNPAVYKVALLNQMFKAPVISLSNSFNYSLNKNRFVMMNKVITSPLRKLRVLLILPVIAFVFYAFAQPVYSNATEESNSSPVLQDTIKNNSQPGPGINIRSVSDGLTPLFIIDGKTSDKKAVEALDPNMIEMMSVLKDRSATAVYGDKGKNGVIIITTKTPLQKPVKGIVLNEAGKPLERVTILTTGSAGNSAVITTGADGKFSLENVQSDGMILVTCKGYKRLSIKPDFTKEMTIKMERDPDYKESEAQSQPEFRMPPRVVTVDGVFTDKTAEQVRNELGYNYGLMNISRGKPAGDKPATDTIKILTRKLALEMGLKPPFPRLAPQDFPTFQGKRYSAFNDWLMNKVKYPSEATAQNIEGWVSINFKVQLDGTLSDIQSTIPVNPLLSDAVISIIKSAPKWDPPENKNVDEAFNQSVTMKFKLPDQVLMEAPFVVVEEMPRYPGGDGELLKYIAENTKYPATAREERIQGRVIVRFVVSTEGKTEAISVLKGVHPLLDAEAIRVVSTLTGWEPGRQGGKPVNVWYMVPITFSLAPDNKPKEGGVK